MQIKKSWPTAIRIFLGYFHKVDNKIETLLRPIALWHALNHFDHFWCRWIVDNEDERCFELNWMPLFNWAGQLCSVRPISVMRTVLEIYRNQLWWIVMHHTYKLMLPFHIPMPCLYIWYAPSVLNLLLRFVYIMLSFVTLPVPVFSLSMEADSIKIEY